MCYACSFEFSVANLLYVEQGIVPVHNSLDALAAAALSYDYNEGPKLVCYFLIVSVWLFLLV